jgi:hypothetical protein
MLQLLVAIVLQVIIGYYKLFYFRSLHFILDYFKLLYSR